MKIYVDGCSYTYGQELKDPKKTRYSTLLGNKIGAEVRNISRCSASNARIVRNLLVENDITKYDLAIIQLSFPERLEYFDPQRPPDYWTNVSIHTQPTNKEFWNHYYKEIYQEQYGRTYEQIAYTTIKNHCKVNNVPLALLTCDDSTPLEYTLQLNNSKRYAKAKHKHPTELGHMRIALDLMFIIKTAKMFKN